MGKKQDQIYAQMLATLKSLQNPKHNPAQDYLTNEALAGADWLKKGDYSQLPKGMFFDFEMPSEMVKRYNSAANVGREGTFALGDNSGMGNAMNLQSKYLADKFARDAGLNYQQNVANAAGNIRSGLGAASAAQSGNDAAIMSALNMMGNLPFVNKSGMMGSLLGLAGGLGSAALGKISF